MFITRPAARQSEILGNVKNTHETMVPAADHGAFISLRAVGREYYLAKDDVVCASLSDVRTLGATPRGIP